VGASLIISDLTLKPGKLLENNPNIEKTALKLLKQEFNRTIKTQVKSQLKQIESVVLSTEDTIDFVVKYTLTFGVGHEKED